jgi:hypothetical protein
MASLQLPVLLILAALILAAYAYTYAVGDNEDDDEDDAVSLAAATKAIIELIYAGQALAAFASQGAGRRFLCDCGANDLLARGLTQHKPPCPIARWNAAVEQVRRTHRIDR